jgi:hypothetical protein
MKTFSLFLLLFSVLLCESANAQNFTFGARAGISIPNLTAGGSQKNPLNTGYSSRLGPDFAVFGEYKISSLFSIEPMIEYSSQGGKKDGFQAMTVPAAMIPLFPSGQVPPYLYADYKSEAKLNYLMVPVLAKFGWQLSRHPYGLRVYVDAGPFAGFLLSAKQVTSGSSLIYADAQMQQPLTPGPQSFDSTINIKDQLNTFNFGVSGNLGFAYHFNKSNVFIEGGGNYGFLNIQKGTANGKNQTGAATAALGYGCTFGK